MANRSIAFSEAPGPLHIVYSYRLRLKKLLTEFMPASFNIMHIFVVPRALQYGALPDSKIWRYIQKFPLSEKGMFPE